MIVAVVQKASLLFEIEEQRNAFAGLDSFERLPQSGSIL
jgi:hypothetical protein